MPRIHDYAAETSAKGSIQTRPATASDFGGDGPAVLGDAVERSAGAVQEKVAQDDVTNVRVKMAQARAEWDVHLRERSNASTPGDPNFASNFSQDFQSYLDKARDIAQTPQGQRTFDQLSADLSGHFAEKAGLFQVASAGVKARNDWDVSQRAYATSVITDPTSYTSVLNQALGELRDPNGQYGRIDINARQVLETKARDTLAQSYVNGLIDNGAPELARKQLMDGKLDDQLEPKDKQRLIHAADAGITAKRVAAEHDDALARKADKDRINDANLALQDKFVASKLTWEGVKAANLPAFGEGSQNTWMEKLKQQTKDLNEQPARTTPSVFNDLRARIDLPPGDPNKLTSTDAVWKRYGSGLSEADASRLERRIVDNRTESGQKWSQAEKEFIDRIKPQLDKSTMNSIDQGGGERVQAFAVYLRDKADAYRKTPGKDPYQLLNPASPEYIGKEISRFQTAAQHTQTDISGQVNRAFGGGPNVSDLIAPSGSAYTDSSKWGKREDGSQKGNGFLGLLRRPDGGVSSEISVGVNIDGKEREIPTLVPTLTRPEVDTLLKVDTGRGEKIPNAIIDKAVAFARQRISQGKSPFAGQNESPVSGPLTRLPGESPADFLKRTGKQ